MKGLIGYFTKEDILRAQQNIKRVLTSLTIRKTQIKTTMRYHYTPIKTAKIEKTESIKCWEERREQELTFTVGQKVTW